MFLTDLHNLLGFCDLKESLNWWTRQLVSFSDLLPRWPAKVFPDRRYFSTAVFSEINDIDLIIFGVKKHPI
jgi:hypothetical protein